MNNLPLKLKAEWSCEKPRVGLYFKYHLGEGLYDNLYYHVGSCGNTSFLCEWSDNDVVHSTPIENKIWYESIKDGTYVLVKEEDVPKEAIIKYNKYSKMCLN